MAEESPRHERGLVAEEAEPKLKRPPLYQVVLLNDDYTPMEFVVDVLERIFGMDRTTATRVMLEVHTTGKGVCGVFTFEIAETKVAQVTTYERQRQPPLSCTMEGTSRRAPQRFVHLSGLDWSERAPGNRWRTSDGRNSDGRNSDGRKPMAGRWRTSALS